MIRPLPLQLHTLLETFFTTRDVFLESRIPFFFKKRENVKIFCVVVAFKAESGSISTKKNNTGQYVQIVAKIFDGVFWSEMKAKEDPQAPHTTNMFRGTPPNRKNTLENTPLVNAGAECRNPAKKTAETYGNWRKHTPNTPNLATKRPQRESPVRGQRSELSKNTPLIKDLGVDHAFYCNGLLTSLHVFGVAPGGWLDLKKVFVLGRCYAVAIFLAVCYRACWLVLLIMTVDVISLSVFRTSVCYLQLL